MFAFLIHASEDKARLAPLVRMLIDEGVSLWIDEPRDTGLKLAESDVAKLAGYSVPGTDWKIGRDLALYQASAFIFAVSASSTSQDRRQIGLELNVADYRTVNEETPILPIGLGSGELEQGDGFLRGRQGYKTFVQREGEQFALTERGEREAGLLAARLHDTQSGVRMPAALARGQIVQDIPVSPYFADREAQSQDLRLELHGSHGAVRPLLLPILLGTKRDRPDSFARDYLPRKLLPPLFEIDDCATVRVSWPHSTRTQPARALERLIADIRIEKHALLPGTVIHTQPSGSDLSGIGSLAACLALWAQAWSQIAARSDMSRVLPLLDLRLDFLPFTAKLTPWGSGQGALVRKIDRAASAINQRHDGVKLLPLRPLGKVSPTCVETWLDKDMRPMVDAQFVDRFGQALLKDYRAAGLVMEEWVGHAQQIFDDVAATGAPRLHARRSVSRG